MERDYCKIDGCQKDQYIKGLCTTHYQRLLKHGDPIKTLRPRRMNADGRGYRDRRVPGRGTVPEHILIAEKALGHSLPIGAEVHHVNFDKSDNTPSNLVICPSKKYHDLLHMRTAALDEFGNANARKCMFCRTYDIPENLTTITDGRSYHSSCNRIRATEYRNRNCAGQTLLIAAIKAGVEEEVAGTDDTEHAKS